LPRRRGRKVGPNFSIKNTLLTIRYWSQVHTTSLFDKKVKNYVLSCQFPLHNFNLEILKNHTAAQTYLNVDGRMYIARIANYEALLDPKFISLHLELANIRYKDAWDLEHSTSACFYEDILANKKFFKHTGKTLDNYIGPLGLQRKTGESDEAFRRRTIEYIRFQMAEDEVVLSDDELRKLRGDK